MNERATKNIKLALVAVLCEHPDAERYRKRAFSSESLEETIAIMSKQTQTLTKDDFLVQDDSGKFILDSQGAWKNFDKIVKILSANGEKLGYEDFMKPFKGGLQRTILDSARVHGGLGKIFCFEVWEGRYGEMERLWYKVPVPNRKDLFQNQGLISLALKKKLFEAEGRTAPEERLAKAGLTPSDIRLAFDRRDSLEDLDKKLKQAGDYLRKEYVMMLDSDGNAVLDGRPAVWNKYESLVQIMAGNGERFEVADLTRQPALVKSILARAAEQRVLPKIFAPAHWAGRLPDMLTLWSHVLEGWKSSLPARDFDIAYTEAESLTYLDLFKALPLTGKADLFKALNPEASKEKPVLPIGLKAVWDSYDAIHAALKQLDGDKITIADLRLKSGEMENTGLICAAKYGHFDKVIERSRNGGGALTLNDFLSKDRHGAMLINILAEKKQLALAFAPDLWAGRIADMRTLWSQVRPENRSQIDFRQVETGAKQATLKKMSNPIKLQRPKKQP